MLGIGIDIVENKRIEECLSDSFIDLVLSDNEKKIYCSMNKERAVSFLSGRWACKEAIIKSLSAYESPLYKELDIRNDEKGCPYIVYKNYVLFLSISHEVNYSVGMAILDHLSDH